MRSQLHDNVLWESYRNGDKYALGHLAERHYRMLLHYGLKFMVHEQIVEDCIQDLFLQLWQNRLTINNTDSVKHYLLKSLKHHILQHLRTQNRVSFEDLDWDTSFPDEIDAETLLIQRESVHLLSHSIQEQLATLPTREREALYLRYYENLSIQEIAEVMNVNRQSVSNFLQKALNKLRAKWLVSMISSFCIFFEKFSL